MDMELIGPGTDDGSYLDSVRASGDTQGGLTIFSMKSWQHPYVGRSALQVKEGAI